MLTPITQFNPAFQSSGQPVKISELLTAFLSGRSPRTLKAYSQDLADFRSFAGAKTTEDAARILLSQGHGKANLILLEYRTKLTERGLQSATINRRLAAVRSFVKLAKTLGMVDWSLDIQNVRSVAYRDTVRPS